MTHYTHNKPVNTGIFYDKNMYTPNKPPKKSRPTNSTKAKKAKREVLGPNAESFKAFHPYGAHAQPAAAPRRPSFSPQMQVQASVSFSPQMPSVSLSRDSPPPRRPRPQPVYQDIERVAAEQKLLHAAAVWESQIRVPPAGISRSSSLSSESSYSGSSRPPSLYSRNSTPPLSPYSASSRLSTASSSPSSSRHASPELMDYCSTYANDKPVMDEYDRFLGSYHATVDRRMYPRRH